MPSSTYLVAIGSNRRHGRHGPPAGVVRAAAAALARVGTVEALSRIVATDPVGPGGRRFANAALRLATPLDPVALLDALKRIERAFGRRAGRRWGDRVLDLDLVLWSGGRLRTRRLTLPHAAYRRRRFVLDPLVDLAPRWRDPLTALTVRQQHARLTRPRPKPR